MNKLYTDTYKLCKFMKKIAEFVYNYVKSNFSLLTYKENETFPINKDYQDIIKREFYTQEELLKLYPLPKLDD